MMSSDLNPEISKCVNNLAEALLNRGQLGAEIQAQKALSILQSKDDKLEVLQNRLNLLEKLAEDLEQANNGKMPLEKISEESLVEVETHGAGDGNPKFLQASLPHNTLPKIKQDQGSKGSTGQSQPKSSDFEVEENSFVTHLKLCNLELRKAIDQEIVLRTQEQRQFSQILEHIHKQLQAIKLYSEFPLQMNLSPENENMALIVSPRTYNNVNLMQCCGDLGYDPMTHDIYNEDTDKIHSKIEASMETQRDMRVKLQQIKKDLEEMTSNIRGSHEKISQEQQAQRALQSAWCARFKIQTSKIDRLRKRYRKVRRHFRNGKREIAKLKKQLSEQRENDETNEANEENDQVDVIKTTGLLRGRLDAAHIVMMKQKEQLKQQQEHIEKQYNQIDRLRRRLLRLEANKSSKKTLIGNQFAELEEQKKLLNNKYGLLEGELHNTKTYLSKIQSQLAVVRNDYERVLEENKCYEVELYEKKMTPQNKLLHIPENLKARESKIKDYESKINLLRGKFIEHSRIATERITTANKKLKEFFKTIETFLQLAFKHTMSSVYLEAEKIATDILNIGKSADINRVTNLMNNDPKLKDWILQCKYLIAKEDFAEETAQFLYSVACQNFCNK